MTSSSIPASDASAFRQGGARAWFVLAALCVVGMMSYIDRQIINLLVEPIKADLGVTDTQISLVQGLSFALFYAILSIPLANLADRSHRVRVITIGIVCWSCATFACGLAGSFAVLFLARMFVGVGEATLTPSGYSILGDYFPKDKVGLAISIFAASGFVGSGLAYIIGGYVIEFLNALGPQNIPVFGTASPWQLVFMTVAIPSILLVLLMTFVKEPPRQESVAQQSITSSSFASVLSYLSANRRIFAGVFLGITIMAAGVFGLNSWVPTFLMRVHGWTPAETGAAFGILTMCTSVTGVMFGGWFASMLMRRGVAGANIRVAVFAAVIAVPTAIAFPLVESPEMAIVLLAPTLFFASMPFGCGTAILPLVSPNRIRAQIVAIYLLIANLFGFTLGPTSIAFLTDYVFGDPANIDLSLSIAPAALLILGAAVAALAIAPYEAMLRRAD